MKLKRLGVEWGAAHVEAQPVKVIADNGDSFTMYEREGGGIDIVTDLHVEISHVNYKTSLLIRLKE